MKKLAIIPAYNEEGNIKNVVEDLRANAPDFDFVVINDCSTDKTKSILEALSVPHINLPVNLGIGGAVQTGYIYARKKGYDIAVQFDGDGQHDAKYLNSLVAPLERGEADAAIGSRFVEKAGFQSSAMRRFGIKFLSRLIKLLGNVQVADVTSGMRAVNRKLIDLFALDYAQDYPEPEALLLSGLSGARITEVPVEMRSRESGESSIGGFKSAYYMIKVSMALVLLRLSNRKERP